MLFPYFNVFYFYSSSKIALGKITNFSLDEYLVNSFLGFSLLLFFLLLYCSYVFTVNLFKCWPSSFLIHLLGRLLCSYYITYDLNTPNLDSDISAQTSPLGFRLLNPNFYLILLFTYLSDIHINMSEV